METNRVVRIKNLNDKERIFDINTTLAMSSDSIYIYSGTYANVNDKNILVDRDCLDAEYRAYSNIESCSIVKVPVEFSSLFEENNHVIFVHGWIPCEKVFKGIYEYIPNWREEGNWEDARWVCGFDAWNKGVVEPNKTIWCGHWHTSYGHAVYHNEGAEWEDLAIFTPFEDVGIVGMDACTAYSGFVNCKKIGKFKR